MVDTWQALNSLSRTMRDRGGTTDAMLRGRSVKKQDGAPNQSGLKFIRSKVPELYQWYSYPSYPALTSIVRKI